MSATVRLAQPVSFCHDGLASIRRAARAGAAVRVVRRAPHGLDPAARRRRRLGQRRAADRGHVRRRRRILDAVATIARRREDADARVVEVLRVRRRVARVLAAAVAVRDDRRAQRHGRVHRRCRGRPSLAEVASTSRILQFGHAAETMSRSSAISPAQPRVGRRQRAGRAALVHLLEAAVRRGARRQAELRAIGPEVASRRSDRPARRRWPTVRPAPPLVLSAYALWMSDGPSPPAVASGVAVKLGTFGCRSEVRISEWQCMRPGTLAAHPV